MLLFSLSFFRTFCLFFLVFQFFSRSSLVIVLLFLFASASFFLKSWRISAWVLLFLFFCFFRWGPINIIEHLRVFFIVANQPTSAGWRNHVILPGIYKTWISFSIRSYESVSFLWHVAWSIIKRILEYPWDTIYGDIPRSIQSFITSLSKVLPVLCLYEAFV